MPVETTSFSIVIDMKMLESETPVVAELEEPVENLAVSHLEETTTIM